MDYYPIHYISFQFSFSVLFCLWYYSSTNWVYGICFSFTREHGNKDRDYTGIGKKGNDLVVFFSRLGYTKQVAYEEASRLEADIVEIKAKERTEGTLGFWWCGRFGMHSWPMEIENETIDIEKYSTITICSPVWVFGPCAPVREFLLENKGKIKKMRVVITHFQFYSMKNVINKIEEIAGIKAEEKRSVGTRIGKVREEYII